MRLAMLNNIGVRSSEDSRPLLRSSRLLFCDAAATETRLG